MNTSSTFNAANGDGYELLMGRWSLRLARAFHEFAGSANGEPVLDVGCGTGHLAAAVALLSDPAEVHGVDLSPIYITAVKSAYLDGKEDGPRSCAAFA